MAEYLLEIGCEELPPLSIKNAENELKENLVKALLENKIKFDKIISYSTPRRIAVIVKNLSPYQEKFQEEIKGPPYNVVFDKEGSLKEPGKKFLNSYSAKINDLVVKEDNRGRKYVFLRIERGGESTKKILKDVIPEIIMSIRFPKKMRWNSEFKFARPIRWIVSLWDNSVLKLNLPFKISRITRGNRTLGNRIIKINHPSEYEKKLEDNYVIPLWSKRKIMIVEKAKRIVKEIGGDFVIDNLHLEELCGLVEYPGVILCSYPDRYLTIPKEIIFTAMRSHQKYIPVVDSHGKVLNYFIAVINNLEEKKDKIKKGLEEVLIARLEDAKFYIEKDTEIPIRDRIKFLKEIVWIQGLGSVYEKNLRVKEISIFLTRLSGLDVKKELLEEVVLLLRVDLSTEMVRDGKEFTELEGFIASEYARIQGERREIIEILSEYRFPRTPRDKLPLKKESQIISIADKVDTVTALLGSGYKIKGSKDPLGLKRQMYSLFYIVIEKGIKFDYKKLFEHSYSLLKDKKLKVKFDEILKEIEIRFENFLEELYGIRYDIVDCVIGSDVKDFYILYKRAEVLNRFLKQKEDIFERVIIGQKRVYNIIKDFSDFEKPDISLFEKKEERVLYDKVISVGPLVKSYIEKEDFEKAFELLLELREPIDSFFDNVFVMTDNENIRRNRLNILKKVRDVFKIYGDFSKISITVKNEGSNP